MKVYWSIFFSWSCGNFTAKYLATTCLKLKSSLFCNYNSYSLNEDFGSQTVAFCMIVYNLNSCTSASNKEHAIPTTPPLSKKKASKKANNTPKVLSRLTLKAIFFFIHVLKLQFNVISVVMLYDVF